MKKEKTIIPQEKSKLFDCSVYEIEKEESDQLFGGFREYKPVIYETPRQESIKARIADLLTNTLNSNK